MARLTKPLTNTEVNNAKPKVKEYTLSDGKGLYLLVKPNGSKLWRFNYYKPLTTPKKRALLDNEKGRNCIAVFLFSNFFHFLHYFFIKTPIQKPIFPQK